MAFVGKPLCASSNIPKSLELPVFPGVRLRRPDLCCGHYPRAVVIPDVQSDDRMSMGMAACKRHGGIALVTFSSHNRARSGRHLPFFHPSHRVAGCNFNGSGFGLVTTNASNRKAG